MSEMTLRVRIKGRVQGVWFRAWTREEAERRGLNGWVRNEADGTVSAVISGPADAVAAMVEALHQGPPEAQVKSVETERVEKPRDVGFKIQRQAGRKG